MDIERRVSVVITLSGRRGENRLRDSQPKLNFKRRYSLTGINARRTHGENQKANSLTELASLQRQSFQATIDNSKGFFGTRFPSAFWKANFAGQANSCSRKQQSQPIPEPAFYQFSIYHLRSTIYNVMCPQRDSNSCSKLEKLVS